MKEKFNLENVVKEFQDTKELGLCQQSNLKCSWKELEEDKAMQEENIKDISGLQRCKVLFSLMD